MEYWYKERGEYYKDLELKQLTPEEKAARDAAWVIKRKAYEKEYYAREDIKQKKREYSKQRYEQQLKQPFNCKCGCVVSLGSKNGHLKTKKHAILLREVELNEVSGEFDYDE